MAWNQPALAGIRVVDATSTVEGQFCGRLFADYGAEVILVERPGGAETRREGPFDDESSLLFRHLNQGKAGFTRLPGGAASDLDLDRLLHEADIVLVDAGDDPITPRAEGKIVCRFSDFSEHGPYRGWRGGEIVHQALSGVMFTTGSQDREPLYGIGRRADYACGATAYISCLAALIWRDRTGASQAVEAITAEVTAAMAQNLVTQYSYSRTYASRRQYPGMLAQLMCRDGWLVLFALRGWPAICRIFGSPELADDPRFAGVASLRRNWSAAVSLLREKARDRGVEELIEQLQIAKVSSARIPTLTELLGTPQYVGRGMFRADGEGKLDSLGAVFRTSSPHRARATAPEPGGRAQFRTTSLERRSSLPAPVFTDGLPLQGLRVLDFTQAWAGPMSARALAFLGAEVIKIENGARLDSWRGPAVGVNDPASYPGRSGGERPYDRNALFNTQNHDKKSLCLDLKSPKGQEIARQLAARCDVVLANFSPHALTKLGLGYEALSRDNPKLVMVEMPAFGNDGPWSSHVGMGKTMEAAAGMASLIGYGDGEPVLTGPAYLDPIGGLHGAAAVLTALAERNRTGLGQYVEVAQVEAAMHWIGEYILQTGRTGEVFSANGNRRPDMAPHDAFPCAGEDQWMVIACPDDETWGRLTVATGDTELTDARLSTLAGRLAHSEEVKARLGAWTRSRNKHEATDLLQAAGVPAAPVNSGADVWRDPFLRSRGFIHELTHPAAGTAEYPGLAYRLSRTPGAIRTPAPCFAEHTDDVLGSLIGLSRVEIDALVDAGVVLRHPVGALGAEAAKAPA
jgi:crotonobetainyl-CoA:carnitine CoA-transferase CaiB-like acyl-CoA transferase